MFNGQLYEKQKPGAGFLVNKRKALFAWEQGAGKTVISLAAACKLFDIGKADTCLIVAPSGITWQWMDKISEFTSNDAVLAEASNEVSRRYEPIERGFTVVGYHLFRNDFDILNRYPYDIVICDEAQEFSNTRSVTRKLVLANNRAHDPDYRWALTGTAISKRYEQLYSILYWVDKNFLPPWPDFEKKHIVRAGPKGPIVKYKNIKSLSTYLGNRVSRLELEDLGKDVPKLIEKLVTIPRTKEYEKAEKNLLAELDSMVKANRPFEGKARNAFTKVRQTTWTAGRKRAVCSHVRSVLEENPQTRIMVFSKEKGPLREVKADLLLHGLQSVLYTGNESAEEKRRAAGAISEGSVRILLSSNAGYRGLDIPSITHVSHIDVPPSWDILDQRNKRGRRLTSKHSHTLVTYFAFEYSLELYYLNLVKLIGKAADAAYHGTVDEIVVKPESLSSFLRKTDEERARTIRSADLTAVLAETPA